MKKLLIFISVASLISTTGCLKDKPNNDFSGLKTIVEMPYSGKGFFGSDVITAPDDTISVTFTVNIASSYPLSKDLQVTIAVDTTLVPAYNAYDPSVKYSVLPANAYSFNTASLTIPAGSRLDTLHVVFYKANIDPTISYMLPIAIKDASGETISGNMGVHYYHFIGNPLAGLVNWNWTRWNAADTTGTPNGASFTGGTATFLPDDPTTVEVQSGYGDQNGLNIRYQLTFTNTAGVLSDFAVKLNPDDVANNLLGSSGIGALSFTDATILIADGTAKHFKFTYAVVNSAGAPRIFIDEFYK